MSKSFQRMLESKATFPDESIFNVKRKKLSAVQVDFEGRPVSVSKMVIDEPSKRYQGMKTEDFCLENQILVGKEGNVVFCELSANEADFRMTSIVRNLKKDSNNGK